MVARRLLLLFALISLGYITGASLAAAYYWQQATALPSWHSKGLSGSSLANALNQHGPSLFSSKLLANRLNRNNGIRHTAGDQVQVVLSEGDLNHLMVSALTHTPQTAGLVRAAESTSATIEGDRIRGGMVINPGELSTQALPGRAQKALDKAFAVMPMLAERPFYLGIEGTPRVEQGRLVLDQDTRIQVGRLNLTLADVSRLTGLSPDQINQMANQMVAKTGLTLQDFKVVDGQAILSGSMAGASP